jgi:hypothetical protein
MHPFKGVLILVILALAGFTAAATAVAAAPAPVDRGSAGDFAVLGASTVTNTGPTDITGDLGLSPGTSITGFPPGQVHGTVHQTDAAAAQAQSDLVTAYNDAAGRTSTATVSDDLGGKTLTPGVYKGAPSLHLTGTLTLDGQGDENAVFIFQTPASTLVTASASRVVLIGGAQACNLVWQVGSSATLGTDSFFKGNILALQSITVNHGTTVDGTVLARNAAVTLDDNTISRAPCAGTPTTTPTSPGNGTTTPTSPGDGTTTPTSPGDGTTTPTSPGDGTTTPTSPGDGTTTPTGPGGGTTTPTRPGDGTTTVTRRGDTTTPTGPGDGSTTNLLRRPFGPLASTGAAHGKGAALSGLALTSFGLMILVVTRRRPVRQGD